MYFDFEDHRPDTPTIARTMSPREVVLITINLHLVILLAIVLGPKLPFIKALEARRQEQQAQLRRALEDRKAARFVYVEPRVDMKAFTAPPRAELSDMDRQARTVERAPNPANHLPFSRGNTSERMESVTPTPPSRTAPAEESPAPARQDSGSLTLPDETSGEAKPPEALRPRASSTGVIADAIRNVQKYTQRDTFSNLGGGGLQDIAPSIQFDTKGVEFGPWLRRFIAQIRRNWVVPYAAMTMHGHVVVTFYVHKDGRITEIAVLKPSTVDGFTHSGRNAIAASNPTIPLPPEYPDDRAFFTVTFYFNENPS
jgi:TonB family protein